MNLIPGSLPHCQAAQPLSTLRRYRGADLTRKDLGERVGLGFGLGWGLQLSPAQDFAITNGLQTKRQPLDIHTASRLPTRPGRMYAISQRPHLAMNRHRGGDYFSAVLSLDTHETQRQQSCKCGLQSGDKTRVRSPEHTRSNHCRILHAPATRSDCVYC